MRMDIIVRGGVKDRELNSRREAHCSYRVLTWNDGETHAAPNDDGHTLCLGTQFQYDRPVKDRDGNESIVGRLRERHAVILCLYQVFMHIKEAGTEGVKINFVTDQDDGKQVFDAINGLKKAPFGWSDEIEELREKFAEYEQITTEFVAQDTLDAMIGDPFEYPEEVQERRRKERSDSHKRT